MSRSPLQRWLGLAGTVVALIVPTLLAYYPVLTASFVYDDYPYVVENRLVTEPGVSLAEVLSQPFPNRQASRGWYRPLTVLSYRLNSGGQQLSGPAFHAVNLALHLLAVLLVLAWARCWLDGSSAVLAALLFALMTGHAEAVLWVSGRSELLAACCCLAGLIAVSRPPRAHGLVKRSAVLGLAFMLALLAKESAVVLLPMVAAMVLAEPRQAGRVRRLLVLLTPMVVLLAAYLVLRTVIAGSLVPAADELPGIPLLQRLPAAGRVWWQTAVALVYLPHPTVEYYWFNPLRWTWQAVAGWLLLAAAVVAWLCSSRPVIRNGLAVLLCGMALYSHLVASTELFAERFLYLPSAGFCLLAGLAHEGLRRRLRSVTVTLLAVVCCLAGGWQTWRYAAVWQDDLSLWRYTCQVTPASPLAWYNYGTALLRADQVHQAVVAYGRALDDPNEDHRARLGMLRALGQLGDFRSAVLLAEQSLERYPGDPEILYLLGRHQLAGGDLDGLQQTITRLRNEAAAPAQADRLAGELAGQRSSSSP